MATRYAEILQQAADESSPHGEKWFLGLGFCVAIPLPARFSTIGRRRGPVYACRGGHSHRGRLSTIVPFLSAPVQPPGQEGKQNEGARSHQDEEVGTEGRQVAQMASKLRPLSGRPSAAVALLHQQRQQSLNALHLSPDPIPFADEGSMKTRGKFHGNPFMPARRTGFCARRSGDILRVRFGLVYRRVNGGMEEAAAALRAVFRKEEVIDPKPLSWMKASLRMLDRHGPRHGSIGVDFINS